MNPFRLSLPLVFLLILSALVPALAYDGIVEKRVFEMESYTTVGGKTISDVKIGWESYGRLNAAKDNVILITPFFSATSHAAGKYEGDSEIGYWDAIIGSGKAIDTDKYYVISTDTLVGYHVYSDKVVTTGPATINPATELPYGLEFPLVTIRDFVRVQKALLDSLGITHLHAVAGLSMGAMQAMEWGNAYPNMVKRIIAAAGHGYSDPIFLGFFDLMARFITLDPKWKEGKYDPEQQPVDGLREARKLLLLVGLNWRWFEQYGRKWANDTKNTGVLRESLHDKYKIEVDSDADAEKHDENADANQLLYLIKVCQDYIVGHNGSLENELAKIKAPVLFVYSPNDLLMPAEKICETGQKIRSIRDRAGNRAVVEFAKIESDTGHADSIFSISQAADRIERFLEREPYRMPRRRMPGYGYGYGYGYAHPPNHDECP